MRTLARVVGIVAILAGACGYSGGPDDILDPDITEDENELPNGEDSSLKCDATKIDFTQETGCQNDGSVEFCLPNRKPDVLVAIQAFAPTVYVVGPHTGRVGCDLTTETLAFLPTDWTDSTVCVERHGALTNQAWNTVCEIARQPDVKKIASTWYE